ncbi:MULTISPECIES: hypothetical protein [unclassified Ruminococcus]|uniref:hypothetical protein n=1 Tax=unclassified Ruminococcus TaxID=2608920 RepID=UPI002108A164|nr:MULTISPECIES: hypothetical protein [unclassified Ruminococcus]MCQ4022380.1 hypothetical protein [Ruminococcus sp. zg-924]MCQ4114708.1 hypothetical protein [Ruminococcus sp. zg-921]
MRLTIISGAVRHQSKSNTAKIIGAFRQGFEAGGNTTKVWFLSDRRQWDSARAALQTEENVLFALPLYVENVPGILLEFLEGAAADAPPQACGRLSFLLQGGFPEASQSRCCEKFLKTLPGKLGREYGGTFIHGEMFGLSLLGEKRAKAMLKPFAEAGRRFAQAGRFQGADFANLSSPEYLSEKQIRQSRHFRPAQKCLLTVIARRLGCKTRLDARPLIEDTGKIKSSER